MPKAQPQLTTAKLPVKIAVHKGTAEYPSLHVMLTDNPRYWEGKIVLEDVEEAVSRFRNWLVSTKTRMEAQRKEKP